MYSTNRYNKKFNYRLFSYNCATVTRPKEISLFIPLKTFKHPGPQDNIFIYVFFFNNLYEFSTDQLHIKLLYKNCNLLFDKDSEIIKLEPLMVAGYSVEEVFNNLFNAKYDVNTIAKIEEENTQKFIQTKLASGYRGISI